MSAAARLCRKCGNPTPPRRPSYCSDPCAGRAERERRQLARKSTAAPCWRCKGEKGAGRGTKYCDPCREIIGDATVLLEAERGRRRHLASVAAMEAAGHEFRRRKDAPEGQKWCARCQRFRDLTAFQGHRAKKLNAYCRPCHTSYQRERTLNLKYGLTWDEYELILACQEDRCAICGGKPRRRALAVDHDHKTGEIRGLLCTRCNHKLLGAANDDAARLRRAADYLEAYAPREVFGEPKYVPGHGAA